MAAGDEQNDNVLVVQDETGDVFEVDVLFADDFVLGVRYVLVACDAQADDGPGDANAEKEMI